MRRLPVFFCVFICAMVCIGLVKKSDIARTAETTNNPAVTASESDDSEEELDPSDDTANGNIIPEMIFSDETVESIGSDNLPEYEFECDLWKEDADILFQNNAEKIVRIINKGSSDTVRIETEDFALLSSFSNDLFSAYLNRTMPDLSDYYVNTTSDRIGNRLLLEAYIYKKALLKANTVHKVPLTIQIYNIETIDNYCCEITYFFPANLLLMMAMKPSENGSL